MEVLIQLPQITLCTLMSSAVAHLSHFKGSMECIKLGYSHMYILLDFGVGNLADACTCMYYHTREDPETCYKSNIRCPLCHSPLLPANQLYTLTSDHLNHLDYLEHLSMSRAKSNICASSVVRPRIWKCIILL